MFQKRPFADALRATAIFLVVVHHVDARYHLTHRIHGLNVFGFIQYIGDLGVALLFVLSGYLLGARYLTAIVEGKPLPPMIPFFKNRLLRIYPLYAFSVVVLAVLDAALGKSGSTSFTTPTIQDVFTHLTFTQDFSLITVSSIDSPMWTMPVDIEFYIALPFLSLICWNALSRFDSALRMKLVYALALTAAGLSICFRAFLIHRYPFVTASAVTFAATLRQLPGMIPHFLAGAFLALFIRNFRQSWVLTSAAFLGGLVTYIVYFLFVFREPTFPKHVSATWVSWISIQETVLSISAVLLLLSIASVPPSSLLSLINSKGMALAAGLSYAVYLVHEPIIVGIAPIFSQNNQFVQFGSTLALGLFLSVICAWPMHYFIERPFLRLKTRNPSPATENSA
jgi:peptidoglycan/LPS O-acetylase OafA/YrhL